MGKNRKLGIVIWAIAFILSMFLLLVMPTFYSSSVWITLVFDVIAYISTLILWLTLFKSVKTTDDIFYCSPAMAVSVVYLVIQTVFCIAVGLLVNIVTFKTSVMLNVIFMAIMWFLILSTIISKDYAKRVDLRQKNHHVEL